MKGRSARLPSHPSLRPTTAKVREALMAILAPELPEARVLDLFAGTGSLGLAALDEGASEVVFIESDPRSCRVLQQQVGARGPILRGRLPAVLARVAGTFDLVLADPPYGAAEGPTTLEALPPLVRPGGLVVFEHHHKDLYPERSGPLSLVRRERYGETSLSFWLCDREGPHAGETDPRRAALAPAPPVGPGS